MINAVVIPNFIYIYSFLLCFNQNENNEILAMEFIVEILSKDLSNKDKPLEIGLDDFNDPLWNLIFDEETEFYSDNVIERKSSIDLNSHNEFNDFYEVKLGESLDISSKKKLKFLKRNDYFENFCTGKNLFLSPSQGFSFDDNYVVDVYITNCDEIEHNNYLGIKILIKENSVIGWTYFFFSEF